VVGLRTRLRPIFSPAEGAEPIPPIASVVYVLALTALALVRQAGVPATDSVWAEDGSYLQAAVTQPALGVLLDPVRGYVTLAPRLLAEIAAALPMSLAALVLSGGSALAAGAVGAFVMQASGGVVASRMVRAVLGASLVLVPVAGLEVLNNASNLHWLLIYAAFWALIWVPSGWRGRGSASLVMGIAALSDPLVALLLPVVAARGLCIRAPKDHGPTFVWLGGLAVQATVAGQGQEWATGTLLGAIGALGVKVVFATILGLPAASAAWSAAGPIAAWLAVGIGATLVVAAVLRGSARTRPFVVLATLCGLAFFAAAYALRWDPGLDLTGAELGFNGARYLTVPSLFLLAIVVALVSDELARHRLVVGALLIAVAVAAATSLRPQNGRIAGPSWSVEVAAARSQCAERGEAALIPIAPAGWATSLPCTRILGS
jgi:hypothetical protein